MPRPSLLLRGVFALLCLGASPVLYADELTFTASNTSSQTPWSQTLTVPRFDPTLGLLQSVRIEIRATIRGRVGYENLAAQPAAGLVNFQGTVAATGPGSSTVSTTAIAPVAISTAAFDGSNDETGTSGGRIGGLSGLQEETITVPSHPGFIVSGASTTASFAVQAANTTFQVSGNPLALSSRVTSDARLTVTYVYQRVLDCDQDGTPDANELDSDGDGLPDDCDRELAGYTRPGSLLIFPEVESSAGISTLVAVTLADGAPGNRLVRFVYVDDDTCSTLTQARVLTPNDSYIAIASADMPAFTRGWMYAFVDGPSGFPIAHDHIAGSSLRLDGLQALEYGIDAIPFRSPRSANTDADGDGLRDLNGIEYDSAPDRLVFPQFLGSRLTRESDLILINLSGGGAFTASVEFQIFNDNEQAFSAQTSFTCWTKRTLSSISTAFLHDFLVGLTNHNVNEVLGWGNVESGWFTVDGVTSSSAQATITDPAILGVLVQRMDTTYAVRLPYYEGEQSNGDLVITSPLGDTTGN